MNPINVTALTARLNAVPSFVIVMTRHNGHVFTTSAQGMAHAEALAEGHLDSGKFWKASILDEDANEVAVFKR